METLARSSRLLILLCLACGCAAARGQDTAGTSVTVSIANVVVQGENQQFKSSLTSNPSQILAAPAYMYSITGTMHGEGPVFSQLVPSPEPVAEAFDAIHNGLSSVLQGSVSNPGSQLPCNALVVLASSGTDGVFNATFSLPIESTGLVDFTVTDVSLVIGGQPDTTDRLVFDSGAATVTALFPEASVTTLSASNVTVDGATLQSSVVSPRTGQAYFIFGTGTSALTGTSGMVSLVSSGSAQGVSIPVTGLLAHRVYRYRGVAQDITGPVYGSPQAFKTLDNPPVAGTVTAFAGVAPLAIPVLTSASDVDGDALKVTSVTNGAAGRAAVVKAGREVTYQFTSSTTAADQFTYTISDGFGGSATGEVHVVNYAPLAGTYSAVLLDPSSQNAGAGFLRITLAPTGRCTGMLTIAGVVYPFKGALDSNGQLSITLDSSAPFGTTITLNMTQGGSGYTLSAGVAMNAMRLVGSLPPAAPGMAGTYTMLMPPPPGAAFAAYAGSGYALVKIAATGVAMVTGALPDGAAFSCSSVLDATGQAGVYCLLYAAPNRGSLAGTLAVSGTGVPLIGGTLVWTKPAFASAPIEQGPFSITLTGSGGPYIAPARSAALQFGTPGNTGLAVLSGGNLNMPIQHRLVISPSNQAIFPGGNSQGLAIVIQPATGLFSGRFIDPLNGVTRMMHGVLVQVSGTAGGYFLGDSAAGAIGIGP